MSHQSESILENNLIRQLMKLGYASVKVMDGMALVSNLKTQLEAFNNTTFTSRVQSHTQPPGQGNVFEKAKTLRDRFCDQRRGQETTHVRFFDSEMEQQPFRLRNQVSRRQL